MRSPLIFLKTDFPPLAWSLGFLLLLYVVYFGVLGFLIGPYDYNHLSTYYELAWRFWMDSPGLPHFNPYFCGGRTLGADPQIPIFHPLTLLVPLLGPSVVLKAEMLAQLALGSYGLWHWLTRWKASQDGRLWGLFLFISGGFVVSRFMVGHVTLGFYFLLPLYFWLSYQMDSRNNLRVFFLSFLLLLYCGFYKPNFFIYAAPLLFVEICFRSLVKRSLRPLGLFVLLFTLVGLASAVFLLPSGHYFSEFPRLTDADPKWVSLSALVANLLLPLKAIPASWYGSPFMQRHEYNVFLGPVALSFAAVTLFRLCKNPRAFEKADDFRAEAPSLLLFALVSAWMGLGSQGRFSWGAPYSWFEALWPGFQSVRVPVRFWYGVYLTALVFSACAFRTPRKSLGKGALIVLGIVPLLAQATINLSKVPFYSDSSQNEPPRLYPSSWVQVAGEPDRPYGWARQGKAVLQCVDNIQALRSNQVKPGLLMQEKSPYLQAHWETWSQIKMTATGASPRSVRLNINHHPYWRWEGKGGNIISHSGEPLTVQLDPDFQGHLAFEQPYVKAGFSLTAISVALFLLAFFWWWRTPKLPRRIGLTGSIASGKSTVAGELMRLGFPVVDLDEEARKLTHSDPNTHQALRRIFGESVFKEGLLDRTELRKKVFKDTPSRKALEQWLHPKLMRIYDRAVRDYAKKQAQAVFCEAALLVETGLFRKMDALIVVTAPMELRRERLRERAALSDEEMEAIFAAQLPDAVKTAAATFVIENSGSLEELKQSVDQLIPKLGLGNRTGLRL